MNEDTSLITFTLLLDIVYTPSVVTWIQDPIYKQVYFDKDQIWGNYWLRWKWQTFRSTRSIIDTRAFRLVLRGCEVDRSAMWWNIRLLSHFGSGLAKLFLVLQITSSVCVDWSYVDGNPVISLLSFEVSVCSRSEHSKMRSKLKSKLQWLLKIRIFTFCLIN